MTEDRRENVLESRLRTNESVVRGVVVLTHAPFFISMRPIGLPEPLQGLGPLLGHPRNMFVWS